MATSDLIDGLATAVEHIKIHVAAGWNARDPETTNFHLYLADKMLEDVRRNLSTVAENMQIAEAERAKATQKKGAAS